MNKDKSNCGGEYTSADYTTLAAIEQSEKNINRPLVYICSPYSGEVELNTIAARRYCRFAADKGYIPIAPHLLFTQFLDDGISTERELGMAFGNALMSKCAEVWVFGSRISRGMEAEIDRARRRNYPLRYFNTRCEEVTNVRDKK